jgi:hypothetical protein
MARDERKRQILAGWSVLFCLGLFFVMLLPLSFLPGVIGEFFTRIVGVLSTTFLMEASLAILGFLVVILLNLWRQKRDGDELVYLDEVTGAPKDLPDQASWAIYTGKPLDPEVPSKTDLLEGAVGIGDHESAAEILEEMDEQERRSPEVLRQRIALAKATGKAELARRLESELSGAA